MSETPPETPYPWLPPDRVLRWLGLTTEDDATLLATAEDCRLVAGDYCEQQRRDLHESVTDPVTGVVTPYAGPFTPTPAVVQAGVLAAAALYGRKGGASFAELGGGAAVLAGDPDVARLLSTGQYATPRVG